MLKKIFIAVVVILLASCEGKEANDNGTAASNGPLLQTIWGQRGEYAIYATDKERMGCWSTAFAQILYYHRLKPSGKVHYTLDDGTVIDENIDNYTVNFDNFVDSLDENTPAINIEAVARYIYFSAIVQQKDFYSEVYHLNSSERTYAIAETFSCEYGYYKSDDYTRIQLSKVIESEINLNRPCLLYLESADDTTAHAMVIDGYRKSGDDFEIHVNMGWEGTENGWYNLYQPIYDYDDMDFFRMITIMP